MNLPITVIKKIFDLHGYDLKIVSRMMRVNKYYAEFCKKNNIWVKIYIKRFGYEAYLIEKNSRLNYKQVQKKRPTHSNYPSVDEDFKNWYSTVESIMSFESLKCFNLDLGTSFVKFCSTENTPTRSITKRVYMENDNNMRITSPNITRLLLTNIYQYSSPAYDISTPLVIAISPEYYISQVNKKKLEVIKKGMPSDFVHFKNSGLLCLQSHGLTSGLVVMLNMSGSWVVPFINGVQLETIQFKINGNLLKQTVTPHRVVQSMEDYYEEKIWYQGLKIVPYGNYKLRKLHDPSFNDDRKYSGEMYFDPQEIVPKTTHIGLIEKVIESFQANAQNPKASLLNNLVLTGGITAIEGFADRFIEELYQVKPEVNVFSSKSLFDPLKGMQIDSALTESLHDIYQCY